MTTSTRATRVSPQAVRSALRAAGMVTVPDHTWEGIRVPNTKAPYTATVFVSIDRPSEERRLVAAVTEVLAARGWTITPNPHNAAIFDVTKEG